MKKNLKKIILLLVLMVIPFMTTGCGKNGSAKDVAMEMVTRLSKDNYKNIGDIFYQESNSYFDEKAFKDLVEDKKLNISGNKTIKVKEVGSEITDQKTGYTKVEVKIAIDDNKIFNVDTIKVKNKWYVYEPDFYDGDLMISVPKGTTVKFNNKTLGKKYVKTKDTKVKVYQPGSTYRYVELEDVEMDVYTIKNIIKGKYNVSVKAKSSNEVKDVVYTYSESGKTSDNYTKDKDYSAKSIEYAFKLSSDDKEVKDYVKTYLDNIYTNATTSDFSGVEKYFDKDGKIYDTAKKYYETLEKRSKSEGTSYHYGDYEIKDLKYEGITYYDDNNIAVSIEYTLKYKVFYPSTSYDRTKDVKAVLILKKDSKEKFIITNGYNGFVY